MRQLFLSTLVLLGLSSSAFSAVDAGLLAYVPSGSKVISSIDLVQARASGFGQYILGRMDAEDDHFQDFITETGFDPRRDLQAVVFASPGSEGQTSQSHSQSHPQSMFAVIARGSGDPNRITAAAVSRGATVTRYQGVDLVLTAGAKSHTGHTGFAFLDGGIAVMGDIDTLQQIVANRSNPTLLDRSLQSRIDAIGGQNEAWFVSMIPGSSIAGHLDLETGHPLGDKQMLQSVLQASGGIHFGSVVKLSFDALTRSPQDATSLADVVRFGSSFVQMSRTKDKRAAVLATAMDNMDLKTDGSSMRLSLSIPEASLEQLSDPAPKHSARLRH